MNAKTGKDRSRRSVSSAKQRRGQKESSIILGDISGSSVNKDMHYERTRQNGS